MAPSELEKIREAQGLSRSELADRAGLPGGRQHIRKIERGLIDPQFSTMEALQRALERRSDG